VKPEKGVRSWRFVNWLRAKPWQFWPFVRRERGWRYSVLYRGLREGTRHRSEDRWLAGCEPRGRLSSAWLAVCFPHVHDDDEE
jgi:hypothetical protein